MLLRVGRSQVGPQAGQVLRLVKAPLPGQLAQGGFRVLGEIEGAEPPVQLVPTEKAVHQPVAVAAQGIDGVGAAQVHHIAQQSQALLPLLQQIPHQDQDVLRRQGDLGKQCPEEGQIAVDIADGDDPPPWGKVGVDDNCPVHESAS